MRNVLVTVTCHRGNIERCTQRSVDVGSGGRLPPSPLLRWPRRPVRISGCDVPGDHGLGAGPSSDYIWHAVSWRIDAKGLHENKPRNAAQWHEFRRRAIALAEAPNLIVVSRPSRCQGRSHGREQRALARCGNPGRLDRQHDQLVGLPRRCATFSMKLVDAADRQGLGAVTDLGERSTTSGEASPPRILVSAADGSPSRRRRRRQPSRKLEPVAG